MARKKLYITSFDLSRITAILERIDERREREHLSALEHELARGSVVDPKKVPADVVTMNSTVQLEDLDTGRSMEYTVVFPPDADAESGRISVIAPIGTALIGRRAGDVVKWTVPSGVRNLRIADVTFQPEAAGQFNL